MFYICIFWTSTSIFGAVYVFPFEKLYLVKERKADMYRLSVYYACSTLCDMVAHVLHPTFFMSILYFMAGLKKTVQCFFLTLSAVLLIAVTSQVSLLQLPQNLGCFCPQDEAIMVDLQFYCC